ncbi:hypothetical protein [Denitromonas ohlonensis]|uniref:DUF3396 domain-containing protein n=2 Tax=Denitromonas TaxID=139331 RepID=A0A558C5W0_9RHOO|nr:hypothetical protein [Denitromonas ohlonensis]TVO60062.1 hypothetical protein FHP90_18980 [Denitromonas ohlonensis]TVO70089.1 hypothetical protein FHP89_20835 [Denitromonas ohlonensis]TVT44175.1 MAG: hypothetical protein FHP94_20535 [Denitromonas halophila]TVT63942.1 MAG: hypothetical protein FHP93_20450 [Denitromonas halophila]
MQRNLSQEAHLWYTVVSPEYLERARMRLQEAFHFLETRAKAHPFIAGYAPVPYWGGKMDHLLQTFDNAKAALVHGEYSPMIAFCGGLKSIPRGFRESNMEWLSEPDQEELMNRLDAAYGIASDFSRALTMSNMYSSDGYKDATKDWHYCVPEDMGIVGNNIARYYENDIFPQLPAEIPEYAADTTVTCKTGDIVPWTGVWVPTTGMGSAALVFARKHLQIMQASYEVTKNGDDETFTVVDTSFHPVKPTGRMIPHPALASSPTTANRPNVPANQPCPEAGWWFTPAKPDSRRYFKQGETMPSMGGDYGQTFWQWSPDQSVPKL